MATALRTTWLHVCSGVRRRHVVALAGSVRHGRRLMIGRWLRGSQLGMRCALFGLAGAGAILVVPGPGWSLDVPGQAGDAATTTSVPSAEVMFETPRRFAAVMESSTKRQRLYSAGDIIPDAKGGGGEYRITQIEQGRVQLGRLRGGGAIWVAVDGAIPGRAGWRLIGTPSLRTVEYRYVRTDAPLDVEPRVLELHGDHARLEVDTPLTVSVSPAVGTANRAPAVPALPSPEPGHKFENTLLGRVRVKPTADDSYEINAADLNAALESGVQLLAEAWPKVWPNGSFRGGVSLDIQSPIADGTLGPRGFRVASPNLAQRGGVQVGDLIVGVNGQPVNGFSDVYRVYRQMQRDPNLSVIQLDLVRQGQHLTKTYRIR
jgi:hypothetical protein